MATAKDCKAKAASAFQSGNWADAVQHYGEAIALDPNDASTHANRSAAYLKAGHHTEALQDAQRCRKLEPSVSMGYLREAAVLYSQRQYKDAMVPLQAGLAACNDDQKQSLEHALLGARRALVLQKNPAAKVASKLAASLQAAQFRKSHALASIDITQRNFQERKAGPLYQVALENKQELLTKLPQLESEDEISNVLFFFLLDPQGLGTVPLAELYTLCQAQSGALNVEHLVKEGEAPLLTSDTFAKTMQQLAAAMNTTVRGFSEFIIHQITAVSSSSLLSPPESTPASDTAETAEAKLLAAKERRLTCLFTILEADGDDTISFFDLACGIYAWARDKKDPSLQSQTKLLLLIDPKDARRLNYDQFGKIILSLSSTWNESLEDVLDDLVLAFASPSGGEISEEVLQEIIVGGGGDGSSEASSKLDALTYARTKQLFELWDGNGDGAIDFAELLTGLRRYQHASQTSLDGSTATANQQAEKMALMIIGHDEDNNQTLDPEEFAIAMMDYAKGIGTDLHQLIDFMVVVAQKSDEDDSFERAYSEATLTAASHQKTGKAFRHNSLLMTISDIEEDSEEESDEED